MGKLPVVLMVLVVSGCVSIETRMQSFTDPDFQSKRYGRILISPVYQELDLKDRTEKVFCEAFAETAAECVAAVTIFPPTRTLKDEELFVQLNARGIEAVLSIEQTQYYEEKYYVPSSYGSVGGGYLCADTFYHGCYGGFGHGYGGGYYGRWGGYYVSEPRVRYEMILYDTESRRRAWMGSSFTQGASRSGFDEMIRSVAEKTVAQLVADGVIERRP